ncbi:immunity protein Imm33 domain-containing protein [Dactylosporangium darangshiense]|uniref:immunity protein Imm33 domain-containing protein n=1 Tax=Dactylosporangium darangshiense TaxID=579108 RepID=UPI003CD099C9
MIAKRLQNFAAAQASPTDRGEPGGRHEPGVPDRKRSRLGLGELHRAVAACASAPGWRVATTRPLEHATDQFPDLLQYLALPAGWGVVLAPGYEDVWYDEAFLES